MQDATSYGNLPSEAVLFPDTYKDKRDLAQLQTCIALKGRLSHRNGEPSVVVEAIKMLERDATPVS